MYHQNLFIMTNKQSIKRLSKAIELEFADTAYSQEMSDLIDYGEFAPAIEPDLTKIINDWNLDRHILGECIRIADEYHKIWMEKYPKDFKPKPWENKKGAMYEVLYYRSPWSYISENLHSLFQYGYLQR